MRELKDTFVQWIGKVPTNWNVRRLKNIKDNSRNAIVDGPFGSAISVSDYVGEGVPLVRILNLGDKEINSNDLVYITPQLAKTVNRSRFGLGDIIVAKTGATIGKCAINRTIDYGILSSSCVKIKPDDQKVNLDFLYYYLLSDCFIEEIKDACNGSTRETINLTPFNNIRCIVPPIDEQKKIANFLDTKCKNIEDLIANVKEQIETLESYKKSVIFECVTRGLNPNVATKESGMGWIGKVPTNWKISRIASVYKLRNTKVSDKDYQPLSVTMQGILPQLENVAKSDAHDDRKLVCKGDFAINSRSDRRGSCGISPCDGSISLINTVLCPLTNMNPFYYNWLFHTIEFSDEFYKWGHGIVDDLWTTGWREMKNILIPIPPLEEQILISDYLEKKCNIIDKIILEKEEEINIINEYKKSLVYEYVTGKKEI